MKVEEVKAKLSEIKDGELFTISFTTHPNGLTAAAKKVGYEIVKKTIARVKTGVPYEKLSNANSQKKHIQYVHEAGFENRLLRKADGTYMLRLSVDSECEFNSVKEMLLNGKHIEWDSSVLTKSTLNGNSKSYSPVLNLGIEHIECII